MYKQLLSIAFVFFIFCTSVTAQSNNLLTSKDNNKIEKADRKIAKGDKIASKGAPYTQKAKELEESGARNSKINRQKKKAGKKIILSASYYKEGYTMKYKAYKKAVQRNLSDATISDSNNQMAKAKDAFKKGSKWHKKSERTNKVIKASEYLMMANGIQADAIKHFDKMLQGIVEMEATPAEVLTDSIAEEVVMMEDTTSIPMDTIAIASIQADTLATDSTLMVPTLMPTDTLATDSINTVPLIEIVEPEAIVTKNIPDIYFTIQIAAERQAVAEEKLKTLYEGNVELIEHASDGWFKYSVGKYPSYEEAQSALSNNNITGFIVAYQGEKRISTRTAKELLQQ